MSDRRVAAPALSPPGFAASPGRWVLCSRTRSRSQRTSSCPAWRAIADAVHAAGGRSAAQLHHGGLIARHSVQMAGHPLWAPAIPPILAGDFLDYFLPEEMAAFAGGVVPAITVLTPDDIVVAVGQYAAWAMRAKKAGMNGVEFMAATAICPLPSCHPPPILGPTITAAA